MNKKILFFLEIIATFITLGILSNFIPFMDKEFVYYWCIICGLAKIYEAVKERD